MNIDTTLLYTVKSAALRSENGAATVEKAPAPVADKPQAPPPAVEAVRAAAQQIESYLRSSGRSLEFRVDGATGRLVVTVRDRETGDTIRQIPSEEVLKLARSLGESLASVGEASAALVDLKV